MKRRGRANSLACVKIPYRLHVAIADGPVIGKAEHSEFDRIERIDPTRSPGRAVVRPGESVPMLQQPLAHDRNKDKAVNEAIEPRQLDLVRHRRNQVVGGKSVVRRATRKEALISLDVDGFGGRTEIEPRLDIR